MAGAVFGIRRNLGKIIRRFRFSERRAAPISQGYPVWPEPPPAPEIAKIVAQRFDANPAAEPPDIEPDWPPLRGDHTIDQVWSAHSGVAAIFAAYQLENCPSCAVRFDESLAEACERYEIPEAELLSKLNQLFTEPT